MKATKEEDVGLVRRESVTGDLCRTSTRRGLQTMQLENRFQNETDAITGGKKGYQTEMEDE